jgi:hypothetical protein
VTLRAVLLGDQAAIIDERRSFLSVRASGLNNGRAVFEAPAKHQYDRRHTKSSPQHPITPGLNWLILQHRVTAGIDVAQGTA